MKKKIILLGACLILISGCGTKIPTLSNGDEAVAQFKNGDKISVNELYEELKKSATMQTLLSMIDKKILEDKYADALEEAKTEATNNLASIKASYGDEALSIIQQYLGLQSFEAYEEYVYINYLQNLAIKDYAKEQITDKEINNYYKDTVVGDIKVSEILIIPEVTDDMTSEEEKKAIEAAETTAKDIIKKLKDTASKDVATKFAELAKEYSDDEATASSGGNRGFINKNSMDEGYKDFATAAYKLKDGEYTTTAVKSELGYHIILRVESKEKASLETVKDSITDTLATTLINNDATTSIEAMRSLRKDYGMDIIDTDIKSQYSNYIQNALASAKKQNEENAE